MAVWICEYPYRTMRMAGPSSECGDCPVWRAMELRRQTGARAQEREAVRAMEVMATS